MASTGKDHVQQRSRVPDSGEPPRPYTWDEQLEYSRARRYLPADRQCSNLTETLYRITTTHDLYIPECIDNPPHPNHLPAPGRPLRIDVEGPLISIQKLFPRIQWKFDDVIRTGFPQHGGVELARLAFERIYNRRFDPDISGDLVIRDEYLGWITESRPLAEIDYYGVVFDHLVPVGDEDPETLQINIAELEEDGGAYAREVLRFAVNLDEYQNKKILAVPRCCSKRRGTTDRQRINGLVKLREEKLARNAQI